MAKATNSAGKGPWHICDDCIDPLVVKLTEIVRKWTASKGKLPTPEAIGWLYKEYDLDFAITWLKLCQSVEFAKDFETTLFEPLSKYRRLYFRALQILNGDDKDADPATIIRTDAIAKVVEWRYELARRSTPDAEHFDPDKDEVLSEILNPLAEIETGFRDAVRYLQQVAVILRTRISKANITPPEDPFSDLEWSKPVRYNDLRKALGISQNTLKARLVDSAEPVVGKYRYKAPHPKARKIQVVVSDLPAELQVRFRRSGK